MNPDLGISQSQIEDIGKRLRKVEKWVHAGIQKVGGDYFQQIGMRAPQDIDQDFIWYAIHNYLNAIQLAEDIDLHLQAECSYLIGGFYLNVFRAQSRAKKYFELAIQIWDSMQDPNPARSFPFYETVKSNLEFMASGEQSQEEEKGELDVEPRAPFRQDSVRID